MPQRFPWQHACVCLHQAWCAECRAPAFSPAVPRAPMARAMLCTTGPWYTPGPQPTSSLPLGSWQFWQAAAPIPDAASRPQGCPCVASWGHAVPSFTRGKGSLPIGPRTPWGWGSVPLAHLVPTCHLSNLRQCQTRQRQGWSQGGGTLRVWVWLWGISVPPEGQLMRQGVEILVLKPLSFGNTHFDAY